MYEKKIYYISNIPNKIIIYRPLEEQEASEIISLSPFIKNQVAREKKTTVYVCENYLCRFPTSDRGIAPMTNYPAHRRRLEDEYQYDKYE